MSTTCPSSTSNISTDTCRQSTADIAPEAPWIDLLHRLRAEVDGIRSTVGPPPGPIDVALSVVAEALDIGATMVSTSPSLPAPACVHTKTTTAPTDIDYRHLERRSRALRAALDGVDDYVWWGGLGRVD